MTGWDHPTPFATRGVQPPPHRYRTQPIPVRAAQLLSYARAHFAANLGTTSTSSPSSAPTAASIASLRSDRTAVMQQTTRLARFPNLPPLTGIRSHPVARVHRQLPTAPRSSGAPRASRAGARSASHPRRTLEPYSPGAARLRCHGTAGPLARLGKRRSAQSLRSRSEPEAAPEGDQPERNPKESNEPRRHSWALTHADSSLWWQFASRLTQRAFATGSISPCSPIFAGSRRTARRRHRRGRCLRRPDIV